MGTVDYTDQNIIKKINIINEMTYEIDEKLTNIFLDIKNDYDLITLNILHKYFTEEMSEKEKEFVIIEYHQELSKKAISDRLYDMVDTINNSKEKTKILTLLVNQFYSVPKYIQFTTTKSSLKQEIFCSTCNNQMIINNENSVMTCFECGEMQSIIGTVFDDIQVYYQESSFNKIASYERIKHGEKWLNRILAREHIEIKKEIINGVKRQIKNEQIRDIRKVTYELIRKCLRSIEGWTKFNEHIPLIKKIITGISPVQLTENEYALTINYFDRVVDIFEQKKPKDKHNCPYHPYFLRKILEQNHILSENTLKELKRKRSILSNIHIQSITTLKKRDMIWKEICKEFPKFVYKPTDKNKYRIPI